MPNPTVTLTITNFTPGGTTQPSSIALTNVNGSSARALIGPVANGCWVQPPDQNNPTDVPIDIVIVSQPAMGNFNLVPKGPNPVRYQQTNGNSDPHGNGNFGQATISGTTISITDKWKSHGKSKNKTAPVWKYSITVTDTVSGQAGEIDPIFENTEEN